MKNTNGLSTMNQGGDDLAIKIAACKKKKNTVSSENNQAPQHIIYSIEVKFPCRYIYACIYIHIGLNRCRQMPKTYQLGDLKPHRSHDILTGSTLKRYKTHRKLEILGCHPKAVVAYSSL